MSDFGVYFLRKGTINKLTKGQYGAKIKPIDEIHHVRHWQAQFIKVSQIEIKRKQG